MCKIVHLNSHALLKKNIVILSKLPVLWAKLTLFEEKAVKYGLQKQLLNPKLQKNFGIVLFVSCGCKIK
jgi:hypothetical protein